MESPLQGYTEIECYQYALRLRKLLGDASFHRMTARKLSTKIKVDRKHHLTEGQVVTIARSNSKTFAVEPYGQTTRIYIRPLKEVSISGESGEAI